MGGALVADDDTVLPVASAFSTIAVDLCDGCSTSSCVLGRDAVEALLALCRSSILLLLLSLAACPASRDPFDPRDAGFSDDAGIVDAGFFDPGCEQVVQVAEDGRPTTIPAGVIRCDGGEVRRVDAAACTTRPAEEPCDGRTGACTTDAECAVGSCLLLSEDCGCFASCSSSADCAVDEACACSGIVSASSTSVSLRTACFPSECTGDADCADGFCGASHTCGQITGFHCRSPTDSCAVDTDCEPGNRCDFVAETRWTCVEVTSCG